MSPIDVLKKEAFFLVSEVHILTVVDHYAVLLEVVFGHYLHRNFEQKKSAQPRDYLP